MERSFDEALEELRRVEGIELVELVDDGPHYLNPKRISRVKDVVASLGLSIVVHVPFDGLNPTSPWYEVRRASRRVVFQSLIHAYQLEAEKVVAHVGLLTSYLHVERIKSKLAEENVSYVAQLYELGEELGLKICLENAASSTFTCFATLEQIRWFLSKLEASGINPHITLDVGHAKLHGNPEDYVRFFGRRLDHIHLHDNHGRRDEHLPLGKGTLDLNKLFSALKSVKYDSSITVENLTLQDALASLEVLASQL